MKQKLVPLSTFCKFSKGLSYKGDYLDEDGPMLMGIGTITEGGGYKPEKSRTYSGPHKLIHRIHPGEVYVAMTNMAEETSKFLGSTAKLPEIEGEFGILTHHVSKVHWKTQDPLVQDFLYWVMRGEAFHRHCRNYGTGTTVYTVKGEDATKFLVPEVLDDERKKWTHLLNTLDMQEQCILRQQNGLERMLRAIFKSWFVDFTPIHHGDDQHINTKNGLADLYPRRLVETPYGRIPEGWDVMNLMEIEFVKGRVPRYGEKAPPISLLNMDYFKTGTPSEIPDSRTRKVKKGDVVMLMDGENSGFTARSPINAAIGSTFAHLRHAELDDNFLLHLLLINEYWVRRNTTGTGIPHVDKEIVRRLTFARPPKPLLDRFEETANAVYSGVERLQEELEAIRDKKRQLIRKSDIEMFKAPRTTLNPA
jgi:hypothetical protein